MSLHHNGISNRSGANGAAQTQFHPSSDSVPLAPRTQGFHAPVEGSPFRQQVIPGASPPSRPFRRLTASESGPGSLLPDYKSFGRQSSLSSPVPAAVPITAPSSPVEAAYNNNLRRRSTLQLDQMDVQKLLRNNSLDSNTPNGHYASVNQSNKLHRNNQNPPSYNMLHYQGWTLGHLVQTLVVMTIFYLVFDAHTKVSEASLRLEHYRNEETILVNQMDRIEGRAMQLQEQLKRLRQENFALPDGFESETKKQTNQIHKDIAAVKRSHVVIDKEVHALQEFLQQGARQEIANHYGHGTVHVNMDLGLAGEDGPKSLTIELFEETPHANWVWLQQIMQGEWSDAKFIWHPSHMILATPSKQTHTHLEFVEKSFHTHQAWTVGLTPTENGSYNFYINLLDNANHHDGDVCLGKIVGGFDALQRLMHVNTIIKDGHMDFLESPVPIDKLTINAAERSRTQNR